MTMNLNRAGVQTRTQSTVEHYLKRAHQLLARIADEMQLPEDAYPPPDEVVRYMEQRAHQWKWATFRQYQASLVYRYAREYEKNGDPLFAKTAQALRVLSHKTCQPAHVIGHTSSRKRKGIPQRDFEALVARLSNPKQNSDYAKRTALWLAAAAVTGLRPCEWRTAQLNEDATQLIVQNAKATNGRANGASRTIAIRPEDAASIQAHLASIHELLARGYPFAHIHQCCSIALNRACKALWGTDPAKRYALYSARHQFAANAKATTSQQEVARLLGHHSIRTARRHYAPRRSAWLKFRQADDMAPKHER
ncbi:Phage integrase family protein [Candidatus Glomeribacter gigasporarum BEG34]|uniref:Phage integrase family protein n=2 Tax=Candidatus Glomeribacter gigasporarum TaxID=132144 RepID=G2J7T1_9BURK|nr:Phage integrase family protein [Candidatus Glomeribacter gigasporarum BEG34]